MTVAALGVAYERCTYRGVVDAVGRGAETAGAGGAAAGADEVLLLDEPTDNLDVLSAETLEDALDAFDGTVLAVTHDRWSARSFDRFLVFGADGRVHESAEPVFDGKHVSRAPGTGVRTAWQSGSPDGGWVMADIEGLERQHALSSALARFEDLRTGDSLGEPPVGRAEALELLALGEVIARKTGYGRQLAVRSARAVGASWAEIGAALGTTRQSAWEAHRRWIDGQAAQHGTVGQIGFDAEDAAAARALAGDASN